MKRLLFFFFVLLTVIVPAAVSVPEENIFRHPAWLILEYGKKAYEEREYGVALRYAREAIEKSGHFYPEAEILIGDVFRAQGNIDLAEKQFNKALEDARQLYVLEDKYPVYYRLAEIYYNKYQNLQEPGSGEKYRAVLEEIVAEDDEYINVRSSNMRNALVQTLEEDGFERLVTLYRLNSDFSLQAHSRLGRLNIDEENYHQATLHFIFVVLSVFTKSIEELQFHDPEYEFENSDTFFEACERYELIRNYFEETLLFHNMVSLGTAVAGEDDGKGLDDTEVARRILELARSYSGDETISTVVNERLSSPPFR